MFIRYLLQSANEPITKQTRLQRFVPENQIEKLFKTKCSLLYSAATPGTESIQYKKSISFYELDYAPDFLTSPDRAIMYLFSSS